MMSASTDSYYFPSLDKCLSGSERLISWRVAYRAFVNGPASTDNIHLQQFLSDDESVKILASAVGPSESLSPNGEQDLETKTAPINVPQSGNGEYDLAQLKEGAKWLAKELKIEELAALRIAIVELQERTADQLLKSTSKDLPGAQRLIGSASDATHRDLLDFSQLEFRQQRLLKTYLTETEYVLKFAVDLFGRHVTNQEGRTHDGSLRLGGRLSWVDDLAAKVTSRIHSGEDGNRNDTLCQRSISSLEDILQKSQDVDKWPAPYKAEGLREVMYIESQYAKMICTLRFLLASIHALDKVPDTPTVQAWFSLMDRYGFLQNGQSMFTANADTTPQLLISIISLVILKMPLVVEELINAAGGFKISPKLYLNNQQCARLISTAMYQCAASNIECAAPVMYGWSLLINGVREIANEHRATREGLIEPANSDLDEPSRASRRGSRELASDFETLNEFLNSQDLGEARDDQPRFFATAALDGLQVFPFIVALSSEITSQYGSPAESATALISKQGLLELLREGSGNMFYGGDILEAVLSVINPGIVTTTSQQQTESLGKEFMSDRRFLRPFLLGNAIARYPYELSPLLRLCRVLASAHTTESQHEGPLEIVHLLDNLQFMTQMVPEDFRSYQLEHEDENLNNMQLTAGLPIFTLKRNLLTWDPRDSTRRAIISLSNSVAEESQVMTIPAGTSGVFVKESRPYVLKFEHKHSALEYLGLLLSTFQANGELSPMAPGAGLDRTTAAELISLLSALLSATLSLQRGVSEALFVLGRFGYALANEQDIISVVANVFEAELSAHLNQIAEVGSLELLSACADFLVQLVVVSPERVWSILAQSSLLGVNGSVVSLAAVVGNTEAQYGRYRFLVACVRLYDRLLDDSIAGLVKRKTRNPRTTNRFDSPIESLDSIPDRTINAVLSAFQKVLLGAFQNVPQWNFEIPQERCAVVSIIGQAFTKLFRCTYGIKGRKGPSNWLSDVLAPTAESLLELCVPGAGPSAFVDTCAKIIPNGLLITDPSLTTETSIALITQTKVLLDFLVILLRTVKSGRRLLVKKEDVAMKLADARQHAHSLARDVLKIMPALAGLLASSHNLKADIFALLSELVDAVNLQDMDPPSILSQLDAQTAKSFLEVVTQLDRPLCDVHMERQAWNFLTAIMSNRQQWVAIYLLTGTLPKDKVKNSKDQSLTPKSLLHHALDELSNISLLSPDRAAGMLRFISHAQQTWVWATNELQSHPDFLKNVLSWLGSIEAPQREPTPAATIISAKEYEMATYLCNILAVSIHASLEIGDNSILKLIVPKLKFVRDHGVVVNTYNRSLHKNLAENMKQKFPHIELTDFQRTEVNPAPFGTEYFYDRTLAATVLGHHLAWEGADRDRNHGFSSEFSRSNANLSLYDAQVGLLSSWKTLATTLCECAEQDASLQQELAQVAERCLSSNLNVQLDEPGAADLLQQRVELAFILTLRLVTLKVEAESLKDLLFASWELVRTSPVDYDVATASEDVRYYRSIVQVLYLAVQPHQYMNNQTSASRATDESTVQYLAPATASCIVDIVGKVIMPGFRALCSNLHTDIQLALPADFALLTALLRAVLSVPGVSSVYPLIADLVAGSSIVRSALSLFSWADQLAEIMDQDPVYGELAVMFLLALSTVRPIAEQMALQGILTQLASANLSNYFRKSGGKGPFDEPQRMFTIWTEGLLPLCLNLLDAVGPPIASDVASFLNSFPQQLKRAEKALQNGTPSIRNPRAGAVTLSLVSEAHSLTMIATILSSDIARGAAEGINAADVPDLGYDVGMVKDMVEALTRSRRSLGDRITAIGELEERWQTTAVPGASDNMLMAKIFKELVNMQQCLSEPEDLYGA